MILRVYYNAFSFPNTVMIKVSEVEKEVAYVNTLQRVSVMYDAQDNAIAYNINMALQVERDGYQEMSTSLLATLNEVLENDAQTTLSHDFTSYIVVGEVKSCVAHPDSDHLHVCEVDVNEETLQIVCGAANVCEGIKVVVAKVNAVMPSGLFIQAGKLRGIESSGMLCSAYELGLITEKKKGILILDTEAIVGNVFSKGEYTC